MENINNIINKTRDLTKRISPKQFLILGLILVAVVGVSSSFYFYNKYKILSLDLNLEATQETQRLISTLGKIIELPEGEIPTIATISDKDKLKNQSFFAQAQNGDILFAYTASMKAILYRPSSNKIINVAPININQAQDLKQGTN